MLTANIETIEFVFDYPEKKDNLPATIVEEAKIGEIHYYCNGMKDGDIRIMERHVGSKWVWSTALSMVIVGLTGNKQATPYQVAQYAEQMGM